MKNKVKILKEQELFLKNKDMIADNNVKMLNISLCVCTGIFFALWIMSYFVQDYIRYNVQYAGTWIVGLIMLCVHNLITRGKHVTLMIYLNFCLFFAYACYSSFFSAPNDISVLFLLCQIVLPAIIVDKTKRITCSLFLFYICYVGGIILFKESNLRMDEIINMTAFTLVGMILGYFIRKMKIENYENRRLAFINEHLDFLTNLYNRKKLFTDIEELKQGVYTSSAFFMIDVDHFKLYNDTFGHVSGDACLKELGACMLEYASTHHLRLYRFGGEEFAAICFSNNTHSYIEIARGLNQAICALQIPHAWENGVVTISIGVCPCSIDLPFDEVIKRADDVLYEAKGTGRNKVVVYKNE